MQHQDIQTVVSGYTLMEYIGGGQFGKVYKAIKKNCPTVFAIKVIKKIIPNIDESRRRKLKLLLETEIKAMKLCNSDNVVRIIERLETPSKIYIVMEHCDGPNLEEYLVRHPVLQEKEALMILRQLACGFQELQRNNIIHRDLKPANIFSSNGNFKIGDLGFARVLQKNQDLTGTLLGSLCFMAPEILTYQKYGFLVDIWSLGVIFHMMLTGRRPFGSPATASFNQMYDEIRYTKLTFNGANISEEVKDLVKHMLTIDPANRIQWEQFYNHHLLAEEQDLLVSMEFPLLRRDASKDTKKDKKLKELEHQDLLEKIIEQDDDQQKKGITHTSSEKDVIPSQIKPLEIQRQKIDQQYKRMQEMSKQFSHYTQKLLFELGKLNLLLKYLVVIDDKEWIEFIQKSRKLTELQLLIAERCMKKASEIKNFFEGKESIFDFKLIEEYRKSLQYINIEAEYRFIYQKCKRYYEKTSLNLKIFEDKKRNIFKDFVRRHSDHQNYQQKQKFIGGIEGVDYSVEEHTKFVIRYAREIRYRWKEMRPCRAQYLSLLILKNYEGLGYFEGDKQLVKRINKEVQQAEHQYLTEAQWKLDIDRITELL